MPETSSTDQTSTGPVEVPVFTLSEVASGAPIGALAAPTPTESPTAADVLAVVDLDAGGRGDAARAAAVLRNSALLLVGVTRGGLHADVRPAADALTLVLGAEEQPGRWCVRVPDVDTALGELVGRVGSAPRAALALANTLRLTERATVRDGLVAESLAYSMLLAGPEFAAWRAATPVRPVPPAGPDVVLAEREGDVLRITLNRPERRNAFGHALRDGLIDVLDVANADASVRVELRAAGPSFSAGGDLDEFGTAADPASAHVVRLARSAGWSLHRCAARATAYVHGACVGAGVEVPSFAGRVVADPDAWFLLPELTLGLIPGAGGTVSLTRRIGRWRTAWMALTGTRVDAATARAWGLVDGVR